MRFTWDPRKAAANRRKHGVSFEEAETVFYDEQALLIEDPTPDEVEERLVITGRSAEQRLLVVCHCIRGENVIRIISARKANRQESQEYWQRLTR
jgi:hypothetical protein